MSEDTDFKLDQTAQVRQGEEVETKELIAYLTEKIEGLGDFQALQQFPAGHSNLTYLLEFSNRQLVLRRPPFGSQVKSGHDMSREYKVLSHLKGVFDKVPEPLHMCEDPKLLGAPFYVMERVKGVILRGQRGEKVPGAETMKALSRSLIGTLAQIHQIDRGSAGLEDWGRPEGYVGRQVEGWSRRYKKASTEDLASINKVMDWLAENQPAEVGVSIIHNDYKYDNLLLDSADLPSIVAVLDWEMATVGDPLMDLGTSLGYWIETADGKMMSGIPAGPTMAPGNLTRLELAQEYGRLTGHDLSNLTFYYAFGLFKIAVIVQQIYKRFHMGLTKDKRFAGLIHIVKAFGTQADKAITKGRIDDLG
jgi:aminoglycoside phosphotransferase (APT) family kinase protein